MNKLFNLHSGEQDKQKVLQNVRENISFTGSNFWILVCAIIIASVGLNVNSTAVIIGAMLISPLMGPIVGAGFGLGTYDFALLKKSFINLIISTLIGLAVSCCYFFISPYKQAQAEMVARTTPNIYDILIAFFGGLVGVIAVTRVDKGNPIPGVAIATALMPPLCTAGFGLATGRLSFFAGAMFLYTINCVFICIATFLIVKYLRYPASGLVNKEEVSTIRGAIYGITIILVVPSCFFAYRFISKQKFQDRVSAFVAGEFEDKGNTVVYKKTDFDAVPKNIELAFLIRKFSPKEIQQENKRLKDYGLSGAILTIRQDSAFLASAPNHTDNEIEVQSSKIVSQLNRAGEPNSFEYDNLYNEAKPFFPQLVSLEVVDLREKRKDSTIPAVLYNSIKPFSEREQAVFKKWVKARLKTDSVSVYRKND